MKHLVTFIVPERDLGKADVHFQVKIDGKAFGKLEVSKGSVVWYAMDMTLGHKASWSQLDKMMMAQPLTEKRKPRPGRKDNARTSRRRVRGRRS